MGLTFWLGETASAQMNTVHLWFQGLLVPRRGITQGTAGLGGDAVIGNTGLGKASLGKWRLSEDLKEVQEQPALRVPLRARGLQAEGTGVLRTGRCPCGRYGLSRGDGSGQGQSIKGRPD